LANVGKSGESVLNGLASVGESGKSVLNCLANVSGYGESQHFPVLGHFVLAKFTKFAKMMPKRLQNNIKFARLARRGLLKVG
jgi:hypothetical protein